MRGAILALVVLLVAGCTGGTTEQSNTGGVLLQYDDGGANKVDIPILNATPPAPGERTLQAPPQWRLGEWWEYTVTDHFAGHVLHIKRVVAGTFGTQYLVGFPIDGFSNDALVLHVPGYGDIDQKDLSFEVHDVGMKILDFPLATGKRWDSAFEGRPGHALVTAAADGKATIHFEDTANGSFNWTATYDAETGEVVRLDDPNYATVEVAAHGYGYHGVVRVPHAHDLVFQNGRLGPWNAQTSPTQDPKPAAASETVDVQPGYDHLAFTILVGDLTNFIVPGLPAQSPGVGDYTETVTSPNGTVYSVHSGAGESGLKIVFFGTGDPTGTWKLDHQAIGPGLVLTEGIGYHSIDVDLPSGCVLPGPNSGHHLNPCTGKMGATTAATQ
ncbi:MAG: hypothetical protein V4510_02315 [bacterium]